MTKKILHSPDIERAQSEFLNPIITDMGFALIGLKTGKEYTRGMVVYTGTELTPSMLSEKAKNVGLESKDELFEAYLSQIPNFKISKMVGIRQGAEFNLEYV